MGYKKEYKIQEYRIVSCMHDIVIYLNGVGGIINILF